MNGGPQSLPDLFAQKVSLEFPERHALFGRVAENLVYQVAEAKGRVEGHLGTRSSRGGEYRVFERSDGSTIAISERNMGAPKACFGLVRIGAHVDGESLPAEMRQRSTRWKYPRPRSAADLTMEEVNGVIAAVRDSWRGAFQIRQERVDGDRLVEGLRAPQVGAIHAIKAHWIVSSEPATLVMPTGTGKTETMLAVLVSELVETLLVVVPTDALRTQISRKFATLGELKAIGCLHSDALHPIVAVLKRSLRSAEEVDALFGRAHVVVATMASLAKMSADLQAKVAERVSHLFIDEAHHIAAQTWKALKRRFLERKRKILQFTATPYRTDERRVDGKFIFVYPLRRAQEQDLFRPVNYVPILVSRQPAADLAIIREVGAVLDRDRTAGFDHLAMARADGIERAEKLLELYRRHLPDHPAALINSNMRSSERERVLDELRAGSIRVIVCVNMLGEGFDLPQLKIAGLHDVHKSEAVTFQFVGRFTRSKQGLGDATVIARVSLEDPNQLLTALYREDADWNYLLRKGSAGSIEREKRREDLYDSLDEYFDGIPYDAIAPRLSAFVFRANCTRWDPRALVGLEGRSSLVVEDPIVSEENTFTMMVMRKEERLRWARVNQPTDVVYNLIMAHWDETSGLLYIHSSSVEGIAMQAAKLVAGDDVVPLKGEQVFRVLHGYRRVMLNNLGVRETQVKPVRFQLSTGIDITEELERTADNRTRIKTNLYGVGYVNEQVLGGEDGDTETVKRGIGCSIKGKIWSQEAVTHPGGWIDWCHTVGPKVADETITTDMVLRNVMRPKRQSELPVGKIPLAIEWPEGFFVADENRIELVFGGRVAPLAECDVEIVRHDLAEGIRFRVRHEQSAAEFTLSIKEQSTVFSRVSGPEVLVSRNRRDRSIADVLQEDPPAVRFADGDVLIGADLAAAPPDDQEFFDAAALLALDWSRVDITKESQGPERKTGTVQRFVINRLLAVDPPYDVVFDGDASGEVADVIAIRRQGHVLDVELYHCKFSSETNPGARVADLYEVCGQAMKSVRWAGPEKRFLSRMRRQEENRLGSGGQSRFQSGGMSTLDDWISERREMTARFSVTIVQPGYSKAAANPAHMPMLASVRSYLMQTYGILFQFWASP
jgi:superfamily II DNA or RNA helicase